MLRCKNYTIKNQSSKIKDLYFAFGHTTRNNYKINFGKL